jgi:hypothetical protein
LGFQPDSKDEDVNPDDEEDQDEFMQLADDDETNKDSGSVAHSMGPSVSMSSHKPIAALNLL